AQDCRHALADILARKLKSLDLDVMDIDVVLDGLGNARPQSALVRSAGMRANAVDIAANRLFGRLGPLQDDFDLDPAVVFLGEERCIVNGFLLTFSDDLREIGLDAFWSRVFDGLAF